MDVKGQAITMSWIPSESVRNWLRGGFELGLSHYDDPPRDVVDGPEDVRALRDDDRFRFANVLTGWAEFGDGPPRGGYGEDSGLLMGSTTVRARVATVTFMGFGLPVLQAEPEITEDRVVLRQTVGGRTGIPLPRPVKHAPYVRWQAPIVWTTLQLTLTRDGDRLVELVGASSFPRHWVYGSDGRLQSKSGLAQLQDWLDHSFGDRTPWGSQDSPALTIAAESAAERRLSSTIMRGEQTPRIVQVGKGEDVVRQGEEGTDVHLVLDGVLDVSVDGDVLAELGPGAVIGERAALEGGRRSATVTARTPVRLARVPASALDAGALEEVAAAHRREERPPGPHG
ncbi:cyclic nucleotide-binding domain-containing protein [Ornithinimicrobium sp. W1665]|uniref:cyclic nucleotide-binding domain-containing protein n=1 Tax=Ornithinimicrobium sp. W1665 TaxID=3416666 RepID=UPI003CF2780C